jgi:hypothetical protein
LVINMAEGRMELSEAAVQAPDIANLLAIKVNRFIPADFVFRCKVVRKQYGDSHLIRRNQNHGC